MRDPQRGAVLFDKQRLQLLEDQVEDEGVPDESEDEDEDEFELEEDEAEVLEEDEEALRERIRKQQQRMLKKTKVRTTIVGNEYVPLAQQGDLMMYSEKAQQERKTVKESKQLRKELMEFWTDDLHQDAGSSLPKSIFIPVVMYIAKGLHPHMSLAQARMTALEDWNEEHRGKVALPFDLFCDSIAELADLWTSSCNVEEYVEFVKKIRTMVKKKLDPKLLPPKIRMSKLWSRAGALLRARNQAQEPEATGPDLRDRAKMRDQLALKWRQRAERAKEEQAALKAAGGEGGILVREDPRFIAVIASHGGRPGSSSVPAPAMRSSSPPPPPGRHLHQSSSRRQPAPAACPPSAMAQPPTAQPRAAESPVATPPTEKSEDEPVAKTRRRSSHQHLYSLLRSMQQPGNEMSRASLSDRLSDHARLSDAEPGEPPASAPAAAVAAKKPGPWPASQLSPWPASQAAPAKQAPAAQHPGAPVPSKQPAPAPAEQPAPAPSKQPAPAAQSSTTPSLPPLTPRESSAPREASAPREVSAPREAGWYTYHPDPQPSARPDAPPQQSLVSAPVTAPARSDAARRPASGHAAGLAAGPGPASLPAHGPPAPGTRAPHHPPPSGTSAPPRSQSPFPALPANASPRQPKSEVPRASKVEILPFGYAAGGAEYEAPPPLTVSSSATLPTMPVRPPHASAAYLRASSPSPALPPLGTNVIQPREVSTAWDSSPPSPIAQHRPAPAQRCMDPASNPASQRYMDPAFVPAPAPLYNPSIRMEAPRPEMESSSTDTYRTKPFQSAPAAPPSSSTQQLHLLAHPSPAQQPARVSEPAGSSGRYGSGRDWGGDGRTHRARAPVAKVAGNGENHWGSEGWREQGKPPTSPLVGKSLSFSDWVSYQRGMARERQVQEDTVAEDEAEVSHAVAIKRARSSHTKVLQAHDEVSSGRTYKDSDDQRVPEGLHPASPDCESGPAPSGLPSSIPNNLATTPASGKSSSSGSRSAKHSGGPMSPRGRQVLRTAEHLRSGSWEAPEQPTGHLTASLAATWRAIPKKMRRTVSRLRWHYKDTQHTSHSMEGLIVMRDPQDANMRVTLQQRIPRLLTTWIHT